MSNAVSGVISKITFRPINADESPNQWQKTHRVSVKIGETFYSCGEVKRSPRGELQLRIQAGKDWVTLNEGDEVQFFTKSREVNGKTYYDKDGQMKLVKAGNGTPPTSSAQAPAAQRSPTTSGAAPATAGKPDAMQERITNGMLLNNAVAYVVSQGVEPANLEEAVVSAAGILRRALTRISGGDVGNVGNAQPATPTATTAAGPAPAATPESAPASTASAPAAQSGPTFEDDDIPF